MKTKGKKCLSFFLMAVLFLSGIVMPPTPAYAKTQLIATAEREDAPKIELDKKYSVAANDSSQKDEADILAWSSNRWNGCEFVSFKVTEKSNIILEAEETGGSNCWLQIYNADGDILTNQFNIGTRSGNKTLSEKVTLKKGIYYLGLEPHSTINFTLKTETKVLVSESSLKLNSGDYTTIEVVVKKNNQVLKDAKVSFRSTNTKVAKVSSKGKIVAVAAGTCKIKVTSKGITKSVSVLVLPDKVTGVKKVSSTKNSIKIAWTKQTGVDGYGVWMYDKDLEEYTKVKTVSKDFSSATISDLKKNSTYKFKIRAFVKVGSKKSYGETGKIYKAKTN